MNVPCVLVTCTCIWLLKYNNNVTSVPYDLRIKTATVYSVKNAFK